MGGVEKQDELTKERDIFFIIPMIILLIPASIFIHEMGHYAVGHHYELDPELYWGFENAHPDIHGFAYVMTINQNVTENFFVTSGGVLATVFLLIFSIIGSVKYARYETRNDMILFIMFFSLFMINFWVILNQITSSTSDIWKMVKFLRLI